MNYIINNGKIQYDVTLETDSLTVCIDNQVTYKTQLCDILENIPYCCDIEEVWNFLNYYLENHSYNNVTFPADLPRLVFFESDKELLVSIRIIFPPFTYKEVEFIMSPIYSDDVCGAPKIEALKTPETPVPFLDIDGSRLMLSEEYPYSHQSFLNLDDTRDAAPKSSLKK